MRGRAARFALDPAVLVDFLDAHADYQVSGHPRRRRRHINGVAVSESDLRTIRRWRSGTIKGVTKAAATELLARYDLHPLRLASWAAVHDRQPTLRGQLSFPPPIEQEASPQ